MPVSTLLLVFFLLFLAGVAVALVVAWLRSKPVREDRRKVYELEALVDVIREHAYSHREIDNSPLATIVLDEIRSFESRQRKELR